MLLQALFHGWFRVAVTQAPRPLPKDFYSVPKRGNVRILHCTDFHGQLNPVFFREPNVNLGMGDAFGRPPHMVGKQFLKADGFEGKHT